MTISLWRMPTLTLAAVLLFSHPQADAEQMRQEYPIANVQTLAVSNAAQLTVRQGTSESLTVESSENGLSRVRVSQLGDQLSLDVRPTQSGFWSWFNRSRSRDKVHFIVEVRDIERLELSGAVEAFVEALTTTDLHLQVNGASTVNIGVLQADAARLEATGASKITIARIDTHRLTANASGASEIRLTDGEPLAFLTAHISGASDISAANLQASDATLHVSGASKAVVNVVEQLNVEASGASRVDYTGNPRIQQRITGASSVRAH